MFAGDGLALGKTRCAPVSRLPNYLLEEVDIVVVIVRRPQPRSLDQLQECFFSPLGVQDRQTNR